MTRSVFPNEVIPGSRDLCEIGRLGGADPAVITKMLRPSQGERAGVLSRSLPLGYKLTRVKGGIQKRSAPCVTRLGNGVGTNRYDSENQVLYSKTRSARHDRYFPVTAS